MLLSLSSGQQSLRQRCSQFPSVPAPTCHGLQLSLQSLLRTSLGADPDGFLQFSRHMPGPAAFDSPKITFRASVCPGAPKPSFPPQMSGQSCEPMHHPNINLHTSCTDLQASAHFGVYSRLHKQPPAANEASCRIMQTPTISADELFAGLRQGAIHDEPNTCALSLLKLAFHQPAAHQPSDSSAQLRQQGESKQQRGHSNLPTMPAACQEVHKNVGIEAEISSLPPSHVPQLSEACSSQSKPKRKLQHEADGHVGDSWNSDRTQGTVLLSSRASETVSGSTCQQHLATCCSYDVDVSHRVLSNLHADNVSFT